MYTISWRRVVAFSIGAGSACVSCWGAWEYAQALEGGVVTYLVIGSPLIAASVAIIPPTASSAWKSGELSQALATWLALIPCAAFVFFAAYQRVHDASAAQTAQSQARTFASMRAQSEVDELKSKIASKEMEEARARANPKCDRIPDCRTILELVSGWRAKLTEAEQQLAEKQAVATTESAVKMPKWLMPVTLDILAFCFVWIGLSGPWVTLKQGLLGARRRSIWFHLRKKLQDPEEVETKVVRRSRAFVSKDAA